MRILQFILLSLFWATGAAPALEISIGQTDANFCGKICANVVGNPRCTYAIFYGVPGGTGTCKVTDLSEPPPYTKTYMVWSKSDGRYLTLADYLRAADERVPDKTEPLDTNEATWRSQGDAWADLCELSSPLPPVQFCQGGCSEARHGGTDQGAHVYCQGSLRWVIAGNSVVRLRCRDGNRNCEPTHYMSDGTWSDSASTRTLTGDLISYKSKSGREARFHFTK